MKKSLVLLMALLTALVSLLAGCGEKTAANTIQPYPLTQEQQEVLDYMNLRNTAQLFSYQPPEGTLSITVSSYVLQDGTWVSSGGGSIAWDEETMESQNGVFSLIYQEDGSFSMSVHGLGTSSFQSEPVIFPENVVAYTHTWLSEPVEIQMDEEIPVALFTADTDGKSSSLSTESFFAPEVFDPADTVQAVTLTFSATA